jgi:cyclase
MKYKALQYRALLMGGIAAVSLLAVAALAQGTKGPAVAASAPARDDSFADWNKVEMSVERNFGTNLAIIHGNAGVDTHHPDASGGRVAVLYGPDGILMVDSQNTEVSDKLLKAIRTLSNAPLKILVNSHAHHDHSGGSAFFAKHGTVNFGQENLRYELTPPDDPAELPVVTYKYDPAKKGTPAVTFHMNGETVDLIPMMPSHLGGDTVIRFEKANVIYIEDFFRNFGYPFADQANGGSINGMIEAIDLLEKLADDNTLLIPGHGTMVHKRDLLPYRAMLVEVMAKVKKMVDAGKSLDDVLAASTELTAPYAAVTGGEKTGLSSKGYITETYYEVKGLPPLVDGRRKMPR